MTSQLGEAFWEAVTRDVDRGFEIVREFARFAEGGSSRDEPYDEEEDFLEVEFKRIVLRLRGRVLLAADFLNAPNFVRHFDEQWGQHKHLATWTILPWVGEFVSPVLDDLVDALKTLQEAFPEHSKKFVRATELARVEAILQGTPKMLSDQGIAPKNENEVQKVVYSVLIHPFPDTVREFAIPTVAKTYKPDIGIKSLKLAIEYKFIDSATELKAAIDGIFTDISAYSDTADWTDFVAVLYMTEQFQTPAQIEMQFRRAGAPTNWKIIPVTGKGARARKPTSGGNSLKKPGKRKAAKDASKKG